MLGLGAAVVTGEVDVVEGGGVRCGLAAGVALPVEAGGFQGGERGQAIGRSEEHTSELQSRPHLVCRLLLEKKKKNKTTRYHHIHNRTIQVIASNQTLHTNT